MHRVITTSAVFVGLLAVTLAGCSGGSSTSGPSATSGGSSGGAVVQGQIVRSASAALKESPVMVVVRTALGIGVAEAATGVAGATVSLVDTSTSAVVATTTTDANGNFLFQNVPPGTYTFTVTGFVLESPAPTFTVGVGDTATFAGTVNAGTLTGQVTVAATDVSDLLQNDAQLCHAINIAQAGNKNVADVISLRQSGMGWGRIAQTEGVPPSVIGLRGNCSPADLQAASQSAGGPGNRGNGRGKKS